MKVLVTGAAGFIGSNLIRTFNSLSPNARLVAFDDLSLGLSANLDGLNAAFIEGTILDERALFEAAEGADCIVHLAAIGSVPRSIVDPMLSHRVNATGTLRVLETARLRGIPHVIVASSSSVYGINPSLPKSESQWTGPASPYAASKLATESYALAYQQSYGIDVLAMRFFNVYGPGQRSDGPYAAVIPKFVEAAISGSPVEIHGDGTQTRDFTYVENVCDAIVQAVKTKLSSTRPTNIAFGEPVSVNELAEIIQITAGKPLEIQYKERRKGDIHTSVADPSQFQALFPAISRISLQEGLAKTVRWARGE